MARNRIDIIGNKFGKLTVKSLSDKKDKSQKSFYLCLCDCGNAKVIRVDSLKTGNTKSCGCLYANSGREVIPVNSGDRFGKWTVIVPNIYKKDSKEVYRYFAEVKCECGESREVQLSVLRFGKSTSCGCSRRKAMKSREGETHYEWTFLKWVSPSKYICQCSCGNIRTIFSFNIINGTSKSCGHDIVYHRDSDSPEHLSFRRMMERCYNKEGSHYPYYGGRGIKVCEEWLDRKLGYINFLADLGRMPKFKCALLRWNKKLGYSKDNCYWGAWNAGRAKLVKE